MDKTLFIIKPNVVEDRNIGAVITALEEKGLIIKRMRLETLTRGRAEEFYDVHKGKPFFDELLDFMTSGPIVVMVLQHENCVEYVRQVIGNTDPAKAAEGTIRKRFARSLTKNAVHAADSDEHAIREIAFFFGYDEAMSGPTSPEGVMERQLTEKNR